MDDNRFSRAIGGGTKDNPVSHWGKGAPRVRTKGFWKDALKWNAIAGAQGAADSYDGHRIERPRIFPSLCDWLDDEVPVEWLADFLKLIHDTPNLDWLLLTKRPENFWPRLAKCWDGFPSSAAMVKMVYGWHQEKTPPANVWIGVSVEDQKRADERIPLLLQIPAKVRFLSVEPLLSPVDLTEYMEANYNPSHANHSSLREYNLSMRRVRGVENRPAGQNLETEKAGMGQVETKNRNQTMPSRASGARLRTLSDNPGADKRKAHQHPSGAIGVSALQGQARSGDDNQSRGREQEKQSSKELGAGDLRGADEARDTGIEASREPEAGRCRQSSGEVAIRSGDQDKAASGDWDAAQGNRKSVRNIVSGGIQNSSWRPMGSGDFIIVGGESGANRRDCGVEAICDVARQCVAAGVPVFTKQDCAFKPGQKGRIPDAIWALKQFPRGPSD